MDFYNLDVIISVGYRVNSLRGTQFRIWATQQLKEFIIKGFVMDDERLKNPDNFFGQDYFEQVEERIRDIRSSERRFYQKITDIYATSVDYNKDAELTKNFFATVQKLDDFLRLNEKEILKHKGSISKKLADKKAEKEFNKFKSKQLKNQESDFDKMTKKYLKK